jgi:hypothetical protein
MSLPRRAILLLVVLFAVPRAGATQQAVSLTPEQMEVFLKEAKIIDVRDAGSGTTRSRRATLSDGVITHDAHIQVINEAKALFRAGSATELNFKDTYRFNIAGYRLARLVGLDNVPMSVERRFEGSTAAFTWWIDDVEMDEKERMKRRDLGPEPGRTTNQIAIMRVWDELIQNKDRNQGNILWTRDWKMWLIDHTRAFRTDGKLLDPDQLSRIEAGLLGRLRTLDASVVRSELKGVATSGEVNAVMRRRDAIVKLFDERIAKLGEAAVVFTAP